MVGNRAMIELFTIKFLVQAVASGAIGHWVGKGLEGINARVAKMIEEGRDSADIAKAIEEEGVGKEVTELSTKLLSESIFYSGDVSLAKRPEDKVDLIASLLEFADKVAAAENMDLLLRGSPVGPKSLTFFRVGSNTREFTPDGVVLSLPWRSGSGSNWHSGIHIVPVLKEETRDTFFEEYCKEMNLVRGHSNDRICYVDKINSESFDGEINNFEAMKITGSAVEYYRNLPKTIDAPLIGRDPYVGQDLIRQEDWSAGLSMMIEDLRAIRDLGFLPRKQWEDIVKISRLLETAQ